MNRQPVLTAFGSCRVVTPCAILKTAGRIKFNQRNIYGFVHNAPEIMQQFRIITGDMPISARLRPFLNIPPAWEEPDHAALDAFHQNFADTDIFVVEISSIRSIQFKSLFVQIHRTRELLAPDAAHAAWWKRLVRSGENRIAEILPALTEPVHREVASGLVSTEQSIDEVERYALRIRSFLRKPVLFVTLFNCDYDGKPIAQRSVIAAALARLTPTPRTALFDPTSAVLDRGLPDAVKDLGHYAEAFEPVIAELLMQQANSLFAAQTQAA